MFESLAADVTFISFYPLITPGSQQTIQRVAKTTLNTEAWVVALLMQG